MLIDMQTILCYGVSNIIVFSCRIWSDDVPCSELSAEFLIFMSSLCFVICA